LISWQSPVPDGKTYLGRGNLKAICFCKPLVLGYVQYIINQFGLNYAVWSTCRCWLGRCTELAIVTLAVVLLIVLIGLALLAGLILGAAFILAGGDRAGGVFSARQGWMNSHTGERDEP